MITFNPVASNFQFEPHQVLVERSQHWQAVVCHVERTSSQSVLRRLLDLPAIIVESIFVVDDAGRMFKFNRKQLRERFTFHGEVMDSEEFYEQLMNCIFRWRDASWFHRLISKPALPADLAEEIRQLESSWYALFREYEARSEELGICFSGC